MPGTRRNTRRSQQTPDANAQPQPPEGSTEDDAAAQPQPPDADAAGTDAQPQDAPATPEQNADADAGATPATDESPEPDVNADADAEPEGDQPEGDAQPQADADAGEPEGNTEGEQDGEQGTETTDQPEGPAEAEDASIADLLTAARNADLGYDQRAAYVARAGARIISQVAGLDEGGQTATVRFFIAGENGRSVAAATALAQVAAVLGAQIQGRAITHDNTAGRPAYADLTAFAVVLDDTLALLQVLENPSPNTGLFAVKGDAAHTASREARKTRPAPNGTYADNEAERAELVRTGQAMAYAIARAAEALGLSDEARAVYRTNAAWTVAMSPALRTSPRERIWPVSWNRADILAGLPLHAMFAPPAPPQTRPAPAPSAQTATAVPPEGGALLTAEEAAAMAAQAAERMADATA